MESITEILLFDEDEFQDSFSESDMGTHFVFKDVEDALEKFNGEETRTVNDWIKHYEDVAKTCGWNKMQKYERNFGHVAKECSENGTSSKENTKWIRTISAADSTSSSESNRRVADDKFVKMAQGFYQEK